MSERSEHSGQKATVYEYEQFLKKDNEFKRSPSVNSEDVLHS